MMLCLFDYDMNDNCKKYSNTCTCGIYENIFKTGTAPSYKELMKFI